MIHSNENFTFAWCASMVGARTSSLIASIAKHTKKPSQYRLEVDDDDEYFIDILLYHRTLKCLVAIELKIGEFVPEYVGKMQFYLALLDDYVKTPDENPSIGIILCRTKKRCGLNMRLKTRISP